MAITPTDRWIGHPREIIALIFLNDSYSNKVSSWLLHCPRCGKSGSTSMLLRKRAMHIGHGMNFPSGQSELLRICPSIFETSMSNSGENHSMRYSNHLKMARFLDASSACLNICTVFFHFNDPNYPDTKFFGLMGITLFLSLKQIRRHDGILYCHMKTKTNSRCGDECNILLEGWNTFWKHFN